MHRSLLLTAALLGASPPAAAATCAPPEQLASLDIHDDGINGFSVPVVIDGQPRRMQLTLQAHSRVFSGYLAPDAGQPPPLVVGDRTYRAQFVTVASLQMGTAVGRNLKVESFAGQPKPDDPVGMIGNGILGNFDMEVDFAAKKVSLYTHEDCAGGGVRWAQRYITVPFEMQKFHKVVLDMNLDGKPVVVAPMFEYADDEMPLAVAVTKFGLAPDDPRIETLKPDQPVQFAGKTLTPEQLTLRRYTFGKLTAGDFVLDKPKATLTGLAGDPICDGKTKHALGTGAEEICFGLGDLALGLNSLRKFHLYFAFKEQVLYVTPAN